MSLPYPLVHECDRKDDLMNMDMANGMVMCRMFMCVQFRGFEKSYRDDSDCR